jgi:trehalose 6-phosphate synthase/phosphatase
MGLIIVSNRLPVTVKAEKGAVTVERSAGGLATGLRGPHERMKSLWYGYPGDLSRMDAAQLAQVNAKLEGLRTVPVRLSPGEVARYYDGFANGVLWPLFHYLVDKVELDAKRDWETYRDVNERFASAVADAYRPGDMIWVHDYQLLLLPAMLRKRLPDARIGFFLHIPFPASETFRILPWREPILRGLLGADLIGFHTSQYLLHFTDALLHVLGMPCDVDRIDLDGRNIELGVFPIGIDTKAFDTLARDEAIVAEAEALRAQAKGAKILLGVDRLDYTKGIPRRLLAFERLLEREPHLRGRVRLIQLAVPTRDKVPAYAEYRRIVNELIGRINGQFGTPAWTPIQFLYRSVSERTLAALYRAAHVMLVTPLRDGMNLVAKEFVASRPDEQGVLVLSEFAGAAAELTDAVVVNPYDLDGVAAAVKNALQMPEAEQATRMRALRQRVVASDVHGWAEGFLERLEKAAGAPDVDTQRAFSPEPELGALASDLSREAAISLLLDYDGTLVPYAPRPELATPDDELIALLRALVARRGARVHIVSGRPRETLDGWFSGLGLGLHAEHGFWSKPAGADAWRPTREPNTAWKARVRPLLERIVSRTPGTFVEEKDTGLAFHYRRADAEFAALRARELRLELGAIPNHDEFDVLAGDRVVEVRMSRVHKGLVVTDVLGTEAKLAPKLVALGDDTTDEDMFAALPEDGVSIHVGPKPSRARYRLPDVVAARAFLRTLVSA